MARAGPLAVASAVLAALAAGSAVAAVRLVVAAASAAAVAAASAAAAPGAGTKPCPSPAANTPHDKIKPLYGGIAIQGLFLCKVFAAESAGRLLNACAVLRRYTSYRPSSSRCASGPTHRVTGR